MLPQRPRRPTPGAHFAVLPHAIGSVSWEPEAQAKGSGRFWDTHETSASRPAGARVNRRFIPDPFAGASGCYEVTRPHGPRGIVRPGGRRRPARRAVTLVELLVAVALTLMVILAVVRVFDILGDNVTESRAILELSGELRSASNQLQADLDRLTAPTLPPLDPQSAPGYLEIIEGFRNDWDSDGDRLPAGNLQEFRERLNPDDRSLEFSPSGPLFDARTVARVLGDTDDVLMATIRSSGPPFVGRSEWSVNGVEKSQLAEVVWWVSPADGADPANSLVLRRRVLLIRPDLTAKLPIVSDLRSYREFLQKNDVSVRLQRLSTTQYQVIANSLADLTQRENRFAHGTGVFRFPFAFSRDWLVPSSDRSDIVLSDVLAFDVRVYDPNAPLFSAADYVLSPTDPGFYQNSFLGAANQEVGRGAFVDLGYGIGVPKNAQYVSRFSEMPHGKSQLLDPSQPIYPRVYCTWSMHYERDGINQDGDSITDEGTNGLDDLQDDTGVDGLVDDRNEGETSPPYPVPLRGVEVLLRAQEYSTQQVRQTSVVGDFLPE